MTRPHIYHDDAGLTCTSSWVFIVEENTKEILEVPYCWILLSAGVIVISNCKGSNKWKTKVVFLLFIQSKQIVNNKLSDTFYDNNKLSHNRQLTYISCRVKLIYILPCLSEQRAIDLLDCLNHCCSIILTLVLLHLLDLFPLHFFRYIEENYSKIRDVEREFANLNFELKLTAGSKNAG